jgi:predicted AAA+ superfamily ATPase
MERVQKQAILYDLEKKMVFLVGPRQVGKTWLSKSIMNEFSHVIYLNYDQPKDKKIIQDQSWLDTTRLLVLDELHKMPDWKNYLKGVYDTRTPDLKILVTGSARLDTYDQMGDSLAGRYFRHRLLPISIAELSQTQQQMDLERLLNRGGFPEPYFCATDLDAERWRMQYIHSLLSTDVFEFEKIQNIKAIQLIFHLLRNRVGSPVSYQSLSEDVGVSPITVKQYIQILESLYVIFRVTPYSKNIARSLLKEPKIYFFDTGLVEGDGARFENLVAVHLLKHVYAKADYHAQDYRLHYLRTKEGQEVDFAIILDDSVEQVIEVKLSDGQLSRSLNYFHKKYQYNSIQLVKSLRQEYQAGAIKILKAESFLSKLFL